MSYYYILDGRRPVAVDSVIEWAKWREGTSTRVGEDFIGEARVSTVFLGINHAYGDEQPVLFETMIFGGDHDGYCRRYHTWEGAEGGHRRLVEKLRSGCKID